MNDNQLITSRTRETAIYEKSNLLILGRYDMSKNAQKVMAFALSKVHGMKFTESQSKLGIQVSFSKEEIYNYLVTDNKMRGALKNELANIADQLHGQKVFIQKEDDNSGFHSFVFVKTADYEKGVFSITFHEDMFPYLVNKNGNFTLLEANHIKLMASNYTIRLYEVCKSYKYLAERNDNRGIYSVDFHFVEIRLMLGMIDSEDDEVKKITDKYQNNYDKIGEEVEKLCEKKEVSVNALKQQLAQVDYLDISEKEKEEQRKTLRSEIKRIQSFSKYRNASDFQKKVLKVAKEEMELLFKKGTIDICFDYEAIRRYHSIVGFKIYVLTEDGYLNYQRAKGIQLTINEVLSDRNEKIEEHEVPIDYNEMLDRVQDCIDDRLNIILKVRDIRAICEKADWSLPKIEHAVEYTKQYNGKIDNVTGFIIKAIDEGYTAVPKNKKNKFKDFNQRDYDYDELAEKLYRND